MAIQQTEPESGHAVQQRPTNAVQASTDSQSSSRASEGLSAANQSQVVSTSSKVPVIEIVTPDWQYQNTEYFNFEYILSVKEQRRMGTSRGKKSTPQAPAIEVRLHGIPDDRKVSIRADLWDYGRANDGRHNTVQPLSGADAGERLVKLRDNVFISCTENVSPFGATQADGCRYSILRCYITRGARVQCRKRHIALRLSLVGENGEPIQNCSVRTARLSVSEKAMCPRECDRKKKERNCEKRKFEHVSEFAPPTMANAPHGGKLHQVSNSVHSLYNPTMSSMMPNAPIVPPSSSDFDLNPSNGQQHLNNNHLYQLLCNQALYSNLLNMHQQQVQPPVHFQPPSQQHTNVAAQQPHPDVLEALVALQQQRDQVLMAPSARHPVASTHPTFEFSAKRRIVESPTGVQRTHSFNSLCSSASPTSAGTQGSRTSSPIPGRLSSPVHQHNAMHQIRASPHPTNFVQPRTTTLPSSASTLAGFPGDEPGLRSMLNNLSPDSLITVLKGLNNYPDIVQKLH